MSPENLVEGAVYEFYPPYVAGHKSKGRMWAMYLWKGNKSAISEQCYMFDFGDGFVAPVSESVVITDVIDRDEPIALPASDSG